MTRLRSGGSNLLTALETQIALRAIGAGYRQRRWRFRIRKTLTSCFLARRIRRRDLVVAGCRLDLRNLVCCRLGSRVRLRCLRWHRGFLGGLHFAGYFLLTHNAIINLLLARSGSLGLAVTSC